MKISIRLAEPGDLTEMQQLFVDTITAICSADYNEQQVRVWASGTDNKERWEEIMTKQFVLVAQYNEKIVGFSTLANENYIDLLYVHKDYQRQGIAKLLLEETTNEAKQRKQTTLSSDVSKTARLFFEKNGFKIIKEQAISMQGVEFINFEMIKQL